MIYAHLSVFGMYAAFITAENEASLLRLFKSVVHASLSQYEDTFGEVGSDRREIIHSDMTALQLESGASLDQLSYDLRIDGDGYKGVLEMIEIFHSEASVLERFQPIVDDLNSEIDNEDEKWAVFGGFFPTSPGYEIDELFK